MCEPIGGLQGGHPIDLRFLPFVSGLQPHAVFEAASFVAPTVMSRVKGNWRIVQGHLSVAANINDDLFG